MEFAEALAADTSCNEKKHGLEVTQTTQAIKEWKLNELQQLLVDVSGLGNLIHTADLVIDQFLLLQFCEMRSKETNSARFHDFEMAPSLRDTACILGIPVLGNVVTTAVNKSARDPCFEYLGRTPDLKDRRSGRVELSWLFSEFNNNKLSEHPTDEEIMYSTRAYLLCLIGSTLFPEREKDYVSPKYLPLLSDFEKIREYAWGAAALAHLYKSLSRATKKLSGSATLLMGWIYEHIPVARPEMEDAPAPILPRVRRWTTAEPPKDVSNILNVFSSLQVSDVNWEPYKDMDPASIPKNCIAPDTISRTWLICFNTREIYVPDRYARQFGKEQHPLNAVPGFKRHEWNLSVDWSLKYASYIKQFQQLTDATHRDHATVPATPNTAEVSAPAATAQPSLGLSLMTMVEGVKKEFSVVERFLMQQTLPDEVARALSRIHELVESSHPKEVDAIAFDAGREGSSEPHEQAALDTPAELAHKEATTEMLQDPETEAAPHEQAALDTPAELAHKEAATELLDDLESEAAPDAAPDAAAPHEQAALDTPAELAHKEATTEMLDDPETKAAPDAAPDAAAPHEQDALDTPAELAPKEATTEMLDDPETEAAPEAPPDAAAQNDDLTSNSVAERADMPREKTAVQEGRVDSKVGQRDADERGSKEQKRKRQLGEEGSESPPRLRRSNRHCVQVKMFKHRPTGKGSNPSDPIEL